VTYREQLYANIQNGPLKLPNYLSDDARALLIALLNRNPYKRLGAGKRGADEIKEHPFLAPINWDEAMLRKLKVPKPYIKKVIP
jgi:serine/threonine protein kinase